MRRGYPCCRTLAVPGVLCALALASGCGGQQSGVPNPFMAADRVPAPATRAVPMGAAQPYYPGDPMPPYQGGAAPAATPVPSATPWGAAPQADITPIPGNTFNSAAAPTATTVASEPAIAVPTDSADLRFASNPAPATRVDTAPLAGASTPTLTATLPPRGAGAPAASFTSPAPVATTPAVASAPRVTLTPVGSDNMASSPLGQPALLTPGTDEAPAPFPGDASQVPRIRLPQSSEGVQEPVALPSEVRTMSYQIELPPASPLASPAQAPFTPASVVPAAYTPQVPQGLPASDGFQPRGEARRRAEQQEAIGHTAMQATFTTPVDQPVGQQTYGYGASYEWLQGRLEYSATVGHWTIRYMPLGGPTDSFGGSVAIHNSDRLAGLRPGDFVTLQGQLVSPTGDPSLGVAYSVYTVERQ